MPSGTDFQINNKLLASLPEGSLQLLWPFLEPVDLKRNDILERAGRQPPHVHFIEGGLASFLATSGTSRIEAAMLGREGMAGYAVLFADRASAHDCVALTSGTALRMPSEDILAVAARDRVLERHLLRYAHFVSIQMAHTALASAAARTETRLVRWLLMARDRWHDDELPIVHETIARMLGVYRPSITTALHDLEERGLIGLRRGRLMIRERQSLESLSRPFYGVPEAEYARLMSTRPCPES